MADLRLPTLTTAQMQQLEKLLVSDFAVSRLQTMELAGLALAQLARGYLEGEIADRPVVIAAGRGFNGGAGLCAARHLLNWGAWAQIVCSHPAEHYTGEAARQLTILQQMGAPLAWAEEGWELPPSDLLIDAIIGYGLRGDPRGPARTLVQLAASSAAPILALEAPSGMDTQRGVLYPVHLTAAATLMLALPKQGVLAPAAAAACGELWLADIGVPASLWQQMEIDVPLLFGRDRLLPLAVITLGESAAGERAVVARTTARQSQYHG
jgi:NAD(P)H-hydrate epimerase